MRRHWSVFAPTQHHFHYTCILVLHKAFWGTHSSCFLMVWKSQCITTGTLTTPSLCCILQIIFHCFWTLWIQRTCRGITHGNVLNLWHHDSFFFAHEQDHVQNDQLDSSHYGLVSSVVFIWLLFVFVSFSVLFHQSHTSSSLFHPLLIFFNESISIPKRCKGATTSLQWFGKFFFWVSLDWFFAQAMCTISLSLVW